MYDKHDTQEKWQTETNTCPVSPARVVVKFTSAITANPSGGSSGFGFLVVINNLQKDLDKISLEPV